MASHASRDKEQMMENSEERPEHSVGAVILLVVDLILLFAIFPLLHFVVPVFGEMFADFGAVLPATTQLLLNLSDALRSFYGIGLAVPVWGVAFLIFWGYRTLQLRGTRGGVYAYLWGIFLLMLLLNGLVVLAMFLPSTQIGEAIGG